MPLNPTYQLFYRFFAVCLLCLSVFIVAPRIMAQTQTTSENIDPRLVEVVQIVKARTIAAHQNVELNIKDSFNTDRTY